MKDYVFFLHIFFVAPSQKIKLSFSFFGSLMHAEPIAVSGPVINWILVVPMSWHQGGLAAWMRDTATPMLSVERQIWTPSAVQRGLVALGAQVSDVVCTRTGVRLLTASVPRTISVTP